MLLRDPWGTAYQFSFSIEANFFAIQVTSAGPDRVFGTQEKALGRTNRLGFVIPASSISSARERGPSMPHWLSSF